MQIVNIDQLDQINRLDSNDMFLVARRDGGDIKYTTYQTTMQTLSNSILDDSEQAAYEETLITDKSKLLPTDTTHAVAANLGYDIYDEIDGLKSHVAVSDVNTICVKPTNGGSSSRVCLSAAHGYIGSSDDCDMIATSAMVSAYVQENMPPVPGFSSQIQPKIWYYVFSTGAGAAQLSTETYNKYPSDVRPSSKAERFLTNSSTTAAGKLSQVKHLIHFFQKAGCVTIQSTSVAYIFIIIDKSENKVWNLDKFKAGTLKSEMQAMLLGSESDSTVYPYCIGQVLADSPFTFNISENTIIVISPTITKNTASSNVTVAPLIRNAFTWGYNSGFSDNAYISIFEYPTSAISGSIEG